MTISRKESPPAALPPNDVWLSHNPGQWGMQRTSHGDPTAARYVLWSDYEELLAYVERMTSKDLSDPVSVLNELRFALGDNGQRSIPDLIEYARELAPKEEPSHDDQ